MTTPTEHDARDYEVYFRAPSNSVRFAFGTTEAYRSGVWHAPLIVGFPEPQDNPPSEFGIQDPGTFTIEIADEDASDWCLRKSDGDSFLLLCSGGRLILQS